MAEAFLSASVELLLDRLISREFVNFIKNKKLDVSLLDKLKKTLLCLQAVLNDAEEKQITNQDVKKWLDMLRDAVFEAEDLFDEINTKALQSKVKAEYANQTVSTKVRDFVSSPFKRSYGAINDKMQILFENLQSFAQQIQSLGLTVGVSSSVWKGTPTSCVVDESAICGRDDDRKKLKGYLLAENGASDGDSKIGVISIVGMGGLGKTTLAQLLYNDSEVKEKFNLKGWAHISKDFDVCRVTKTLLDCVSSKAIDINHQTYNLNTLHVELQQSLSHKKFLLVLDDIWEGNYVDWKNLKGIFNVGEMGSKIIITTRDERVALSMQTFLPIHYLTPLPSEDCWSLLSKHAFGAGNCPERSNLEVIGREISKKCDGLPLAAVAVGGLLRTKISQDDWNKVLKSDIWALPDNAVKPALLLSYHYLPSPLKRCFAYCAIFPKNSRFEKETVVQLWIANDLVHHLESHRSMEEVGDEYFDELVSRSLIHRQSILKFGMHDLINDLATQASSAYCVRLDEQMPHETTRHLSYNKGVYDTFNRFDPLFGSKALRTFVGLPLEEAWRKLERYISNKMIEDLLPEMKQLRAVSLRNYRNITVLSNSIGDLIYLRYLNLSNTKIKRLPSVICKLCNLQFLLLSNCDDLIELPEDIGKLVNLRHLDISGCKLKEMPVQIGRLENIQTLSDFIVSKEDDGLKIPELRKFTHLRGKLCISNLQNVTDPSDASITNLKTKEQISKLELKWDPHAYTIEGSSVQTDVIEQLQPSKYVSDLRISGYYGTRFPNWLGDSTFKKIVFLEIGHCYQCSFLPPLGQLPSLKELYIIGTKLVKSVGVEFHGSCSPSFPSLEKLTFEGMEEWEEWNLNGDTSAEFPTLKYLSLYSCPKLKGNFPRNLSSLTELKIFECPLLESRHNNMIIKPSDLFGQFQFPLRKLEIYNIPSLTSFPIDGLPKTLQSLTIWSCENLEFPPHDSLSNYASLEHLRIYWSCNSMTSFALGSLPVLKSLELERSKNLKSILVAEDASKSLSFLQDISIGYCDELESLCPNGLPTPNLISFEVNGCKKLTSLPKSFNTLTSLQELRISELPSVQSFAKEGIPINLQTLYIKNVGGIIEWGLERLACLSDLDIGGDDLVKALMKKELPLLPVSLVSLDISELGDIKCLEGKWLQHLTSLQDLHISRSPKLKSLPEEGLPSSLSVLKIWGCPLLEASYKKKRGKEWLKIARIPFVIIGDDEVIKS